MKTKRWITGCVVLIVIVVLIGGVIAFLVPGAERQVLPARSSIIVMLSAPQSEDQVTLGQFTAITAVAVGAKPITSLELWIDGAPSETKTAPVGARLLQFNASWTWTPAREGEHTLIVRAVDAANNIGMSNVVRVIATKDDSDVPAVAVQAKPGDTVPALARKNKTTPQQIVDLNPALNPNGPITPGQLITVPVPVPPPPAAPEPPLPADPPGNPNQPPASDPPNKFIIWWNKNIVNQFAPSQPPAAPGLTANVGAGNCVIHLYIYDKSDNEDGFSVYQLDPVSFGFKRIALLDAHHGAQPIHYVDPVSTGKYLYYVASFNSAGESPSKFDQAAIIEPCGDPQSSLQISNAKVTVDQPFDKIYCYLQIDDGDWTRVPPASHQFIEPTKPGEFELSDYLKALTPSPPPPQIKLALECWGWHGGALVYLGQATETIKQGHVQIQAPSWHLIGNLAVQKQLLYGDWPDPKIAAPVNLRLTADRAECVSHAPNDPAWKTQCYAWASTLFLTWDWSPQGCTSKKCDQEIDGFSVYTQRANEPAPKLLTSVGRDQTMVPILFASLTPPDVAFVRAYTNNPASESPNSNEVPLIQHQTTVDLTPIDRLTLWRIQAENCGDYISDSAFYFDVQPIPPGAVVEGFQHNDQDCDYHNIVARGAVLFDITKIPTWFVSAHLKTKLGTPITTHTEFPSNSFCPPALMLGTQNWRGNPWGGHTPYPPIPAENYLPADTNSNPALPQDWDVTSAVKQWVQGTKPNYGFVLAGRSSWQERIDTDMGMGACEYPYGDFVLEYTDIAP